MRTEVRGFKPGGIFNKISLFASFYTISKQKLHKIGVIRNFCLVVGKDSNFSDDVTLFPSKKKTNNHYVLYLFGKASGYVGNV